MSEQIKALVAPREMRNVANMVARDAGGSTVVEFFEAHKSSIAAVLPSHQTVERTLKVALRAMKTTPKLMECTISSLFGAVVSLAQLGLW